jgi:hypothetical protein
MTIKFDQAPVDGGATKESAAILGGVTSRVVPITAAQLAAVNAYLDAIAAGVDTSAVEAEIGNL